MGVKMKVSGGQQVASERSDSTPNTTGIVSRVQAVAVTLAVWGWIPIWLAELINGRGGARDE